MKLSVSRYETKWYHPMVSNFIHDFTLLSLRSLLRIYNPIEQETCQNDYQLVFLKLCILKARPPEPKKTYRMFIEEVINYHYTHVEQACGTLK